MVRSRQTRLRYCFGRYCRRVKVGSMRTSNMIYLRKNCAAPHNIIGICTRNRFNRTGKTTTYINEARKRKKVLQLLVQSNVRTFTTHPSRCSLKDTYRHANQNSLSVSPCDAHVHQSRVWGAAWSNASCNTSLCSRCKSLLPKLVVPCCLNFFSTPLALEVPRFRWQTYKAGYK